MPSLVKSKIAPEEQFMGVVNDVRLRMSIAALADRYSERVREMIYRAYNDPVLLNTYQAVRNSDIHFKTVGQARRRKVLNFPNGYIFDFVNTVMTELYGPKWLDNDKALKHELVRPWWTVNKL